MKKNTLGIAKGVKCWENSLNFCLYNIYINLVIVRELKHLSQDHNVHYIYNLFCWFSDSSLTYSVLSSNVEINSLLRKLWCTVLAGPINTLCCFQTSHKWTSQEITIFADTTLVSEITFTLDTYTADLLLT